MAKECSNTSCTKEDCSNCKSKQDGGIPKEELNDFSKIGKVIGVVSGKGGVGKSFVTASLANMMAKRGFRVGILDADITGPSIPKMYRLMTTWAIPGPSTPSLQPHLSPKSPHTRRWGQPRSLPPASPSPCLCPRRR